MSLVLGKSFNRSYGMRVPFQEGHYNISTFFNKKSPFLLFRIDPDFQDKNEASGVKINMFKNLESSKFVNTFISLHNYRKSTLDILNQFNEIKADYYLDVNFLFNETLNVNKTTVNDKVLVDVLTLYGFTLSAYNNEFVFIIAERQHINSKIGKKIVRTTGVQISTAPALQHLEDFYQESLTAGKQGNIPKPVVPSDQKEVITLNDKEE